MRENGNTRAHGNAAARAIGKARRSGEHTAKRTRGGKRRVKAVSDKTGKAFGSVKIAFDACCVALAVALSFILCGEILEVREGTLVAALLTGVFVNLFGRLFTSFGNAESPAV